MKDQVHHPSDTGAQAIAITDNEDQETIHSPIQITAVLNLVPVCSTPEGKRQNPCFLLIFFLLRGFHLSKNCFFLLLEACPICHLLFLLAVTTAFIISMLLSELLPTVLLQD